MKQSVGTYGRIVAGLVVPIVILLLALALDRSGAVEIPWVGGVVVVVLLAGFCCGLLLRSLHAATYIFVLWMAWAVVALATDNGISDPPVESGVFAVLILLSAPAILAAMVGVLTARLCQACRWQ